MKGPYHILVFTLVALYILPGGSQSSSDTCARERVNFDDNWRFQKGDPEDASDQLS